MKEFLFTVCLGLVLSGTATADGHDSMTEDQAAMMQAWMDAWIQGERHQEMMKSAGVWEAKMKMWMDPSAPPMEVTYSVTRTPTLGGRVLEEKWEGDFMGQPFAGLARGGYDNVSKRYWSTWTDNMSTSMMTSYGQYDEEMDAIVMLGEGPDPVTGGVIPNRSVVRHLSADEEQFEMYEVHDGQEVKTMEAHLTRK